MDVTRLGAHSTKRAPAASFTGTVWQDPVIEAAAPAHLRATRVTFEPGARTAWHTHPLGQTIHILSGIGRVQAVGGPVKEVRPGDTVCFAPNERHWHGAAPGSMMVHLAMLESLDGEHVTWLEHVTDEEYGLVPE